MVLMSFFFVVATQNRRIQSFPRRLLDPRRPHRRPTSEELEEQLIEYDPVLPNDPRRVLSHNYDVSPSIIAFLDAIETVSSGRQRSTNRHCTSPSRVNLSDICIWIGYVPYPGCAI